MTEAQAIEAMLEAWQDGWEDLHPDDPTDPDYVPYILENEAAAAVSKWARVTIVETVRQQTTSGPAGSRRYEVRGRIAVQLFVEVDQGSLELTQLTDDVRTVLEGRTITTPDDGDIAMFEASGGLMTPDGRWLMRLVTVPWLYVELR